MVPRRIGNGIVTATDTIISIQKAEQGEGSLEQATKRAVGPESENVTGKLKKKERKKKKV